MEDNTHPPSFFKKNEYDNKTNIHITPICKPVRTQSLSTTMRLGTPLQMKRQAQSPGEGTPTPKYPMLSSPVLSIQQELIDIFASDSDILPTKTDLLNMDLMSQDSIFKNGAEFPCESRASYQIKSPEIETPTQFPFGTVNPDISQTSNQNQVKKPSPQSTNPILAHCGTHSDNQVQAPITNENLGLAAIIKLIKETVMIAMLPLKEEISLLRATITTLNQEPLPQEGQAHSLAPLTQRSLPQTQQGQFASPNIRQTAQKSQISSSAAYNASSKSWGLLNQGRQAKSYSKTLSKNLEVVKSPVPTLQPTPVVKKKELNNPAFDLARRCIGFHPITSIDVGTIGGPHIDSDSEDLKFQLAGKESIREFLHVEMNMSVLSVDDLRIKNVFYPPIGAVSRSLFCEFFSEEEASLVRKNARNLRTVDGKRSKLIDFIPRSLEDRHRAVEKEAFLIRQNDMDPTSGKSNLSTRIWLTNDIELRVRRKGDTTAWGRIEKVVLNDLPEQAPKRPWPKPDYVSRHRPETPRFPFEKSALNNKTSTSATNNQLQIDNIWNLLDDNCQS